MLATQPPCPPPRCATTVSSKVYDSRDSGAQLTLGVKTGEHSGRLRLLPLPAAQKRRTFTEDAGLGKLGNAPRERHAQKHAVVDALLLAAGAAMPAGLDLGRQGWSHIRWSSTGAHARNTGAAMLTKSRE